MSATDSRYLALWKRLSRVTEALTAAGRVEDADYWVADFFITFPDLDELERHVEMAEKDLPRPSA